MMIKAQSGKVLAIESLSHGALVRAVSLVGMRVNGPRIRYVDPGDEIRFGERFYVEPAGAPAGVSIRVTLA